MVQMHVRRHHIVDISRFEAKLSHPRQHSVWPVDGACIDHTGVFAIPDDVSRGRITANVVGVDPCDALTHIGQPDVFEVEIQAGSRGTKPRATTTAFHFSGWHGSSNHFDPG